MWLTCTPPPPCEDPGYLLSTHGNLIWPHSAGGTRDFVASCNPTRKVTVLTSVWVLLIWGVIFSVELWEVILLVICPRRHNRTFWNTGDYRVCIRCQTSSHTSSILLWVECVPQKKHVLGVLSPNPSGCDPIWISKRDLYRGNEDKVRSVRWVWFDRTGVLIERRYLDTDRHRGKMANYQPRGAKWDRPFPHSLRNELTGTLILDF